MGNYVFFCANVKVERSVRRNKQMKSKIFNQVSGSGKAMHTEDVVNAK